MGEQHGRSVAACASEAPFGPDASADPDQSGTQRLARPDRTPRYALAPLMRAAGVASMAELRATFPMNGATYRRVLDEGLSEVQADRLAVRLGLLPWDVWPDWLEAAEVECAATDCAVRFVPAQGHQRFCHSSCSSRQRRRDRYRRDPAYREQRKGASRRYYEVNGETVRERNRVAKAEARQRAAERRDAA